MTRSVDAHLQPILSPPIEMEVLPLASFGRKDGLIYLLPCALLSKPMDVRSHEVTFSIENLQKKLQSKNFRHCILPSHSLEVLSLEDWQKLSEERSQFFLQITSGPELNNYKMKMLDILDLGFFIQIWFDNAREYRELHENWQGLYPEQISLCFLPNKSFDHRLLLNYQLKPGLQTLFLPKQSPLDSRLNFEEILWFRQALFEVSPKSEILILPQSLNELKSEELEFFQTISYPALENMLLKKNKLLYFFLLMFRGFQYLKMSFILDVLKQLLFFLARPTWRGSKAVVDLFAFKVVELCGFAKVSVVQIYWQLRRTGAFVKNQYWEFHRGPYQYFWKGRLALHAAMIRFKYFFIRWPGRIVVAFWSFHSGPYQRLIIAKLNAQDHFRQTFWSIYRTIYSFGVSIYFTIKNFPIRLRTFSWRIFLHPHKFYWFLRDQGYRFIRTAYWRFYDLCCRFGYWFYWFLYSLSHRIANRSYYTVHSFFYFFKFVILNLRTWILVGFVFGNYSPWTMMNRCAGLIHVGTIRFYYFVRSLACWSRILFMRFLTRLFWTLAQIYFFPPRFYGWTIRMVWAFHRGPYQQLLALARFLRIALLRIYWQIYRWTSLMFFKLCAIPHYLYGLSVRTFWWWHRGPYQFLWRLRSWQISVQNRLFWWAYSFARSIVGRWAFVIGYTRFFFGLIYWQVILRLWYVLRFPLFKTYWFISFQFKKRILKRISTSESPV